MTNPKGCITIVKAAGLYIYIFYIHIQETLKRRLDKKGLPCALHRVRGEGP